MYNYFTDVLIGASMKISKDIIAREIQGDTVLLNLVTGDYFSLNSVGTDIYNCLAEGLTVEQVRSCLLDKYDVDINQLDNDIALLLSELRTQGIVEENTAE